MNLIRYWITFKIEDKKMNRFLTIKRGVGVTAINFDDAMFMIREKIDHIDDLKIDSIKENIKFEDLEENHVKKNMGSMAVRGIWFPNFSY